ncbi:RNA polymerase sigma factor [Thermoproteota archaeon]
MQALHSIYEITSKFVYNVILRMVKDRRDAEDLTHEVYLKIYEKRKKFRGDAEITTWIYRIAVNMTLNFIKRNMKFVGDIDPDTIKSEDRSYERTEHNLDNSDVMMLLDKLKPEHKIMLLMRFMKELSYEEIAHCLHIGTGTVKSRLNRAKKALEIAYHEHYSTMILKGGALK